MVSTHCTIGIDVGTSACKVLAVSEDLEVIAETSMKYETRIPKPGWAEQDPNDWWNAAFTCLKSISKTLNEKNVKVSGIGLTGQMHSLVLLDNKGSVLRPAILWNDQRNQEQCIRIINKFGGLDKLISLIKNGLPTGVTLGKILWVMENEPEIFSKVAKFLLPKDFVRYKLTQNFVTDVSDASGTHLFDIRRKKWSDEIMETIGIPSNILPDEVVESCEISGYVSSEICRELGWNNDVPVVGGGADVIVQATCSGAISPTKLGIIVGTAGIVAITIESIDVIKNHEGILQLYCSVMPNKWMLYGCTLAAGSSIEWLRATLCDLEDIVAKFIGKSVYDVMSEEASKSHIGSGGIFYLPFLSGERAPYLDPNARGVFIGLNLKTRKHDFIRSVMEGVTYSLRSVADKIMEEIRDLGIHSKEVYLTGGGALNPLWRQIFADVFGKEIKVLKYSEKGGAFGAAVLAGVGAGIWRDIEEVVNSLDIVHINEPLPDNIKLYEEHYKVYLQIYPALKKIFNLIASLQSEYVSE